jgi:DNA polymerase III subunit gamma/tau
MGTQGLSLKWRPQLFQDVVGQEPIVQTLKQALAQNKVAHAYLFSGPRGTGKTSTARILAKALNCQSLVPGSGLPQIENQTEPDNSCHTCLAVSEGRSFDLIEMDAASHGRIDDIRSLLERVFGSGPAEGRAKVYIIDEAHMLTVAAFNALLKTLEEPAPWAYFILCTTEADKIPPTVRSRCQRFDFRRISSSKLLSRLETICVEEQIPYEIEALRTVVRVTAGSLRDACNILEQAVTAHGNELKLTTLQSLLGLSQDESALKLARYALTANIPAGLTLIHEITTQGGDLRMFHLDLVEFLRGVLLEKSGLTTHLNYSEEVVSEIKTLAREVDWETVIRTIQIFGAVDFRANTSGSPLPIELALIESAPNQKVVSEPDSTITAKAVKAIDSPSPSISPNAESTESVASLPDTSYDMRLDSPETLTSSQTNHIQTDLTPISEHTGPDTSPITKDDSASLMTKLTLTEWDTLYRTLKRFRGKNFNIGSLLLDCRDALLSGENLILQFKSQANKERFESEVDHPPSTHAIEDAIVKALGKSYGLILATTDSAAPIADRKSGHLVRAAIALGARIIPGQENTL